MDNLIVAIRGQPPPTGPLLGYINRNFHIWKLYLEATKEKTDKFQP